MLPQAQWLEDQILSLSSAIHLPALEHVFPTQSSLFSKRRPHRTGVRLKQQRDVKVFWKHLYKHKWTLLPIYSNAMESDFCLSQHASPMASILITGCFPQWKKGCEQFSREAVFFFLISLLFPKQ